MVQGWTVWEVLTLFLSYQYGRQSLSSGWNKKPRPVRVRAIRWLLDSSPPPHAWSYYAGGISGFFFTVTWERYDELLGCVSVLPETSKAIYRMWVQVETRACACICPTSGRWVLHTHVSVFIRIKSKNRQFYTVILDRKHDSLCNISKSVSQYLSHSVSIDA